MWFRSRIVGIGEDRSVWTGFRYHASQRIIGITIGSMLVGNAGQPVQGVVCKDLHQGVLQVAATGHIGEVIILVMILLNDIVVASGLNGIQPIVVDVILHLGDESVPCGELRGLEQGGRLQSCP